MTGCECLRKTFVKYRDTFKTFIFTISLRTHLSQSPQQVPQKISLKKHRCLCKFLFLMPTKSTRTKFSHYKCSMIILTQLQRERERANIVGTREAQGINKKNGWKKLGKNLPIF